MCVLCVLVGRKRAQKEVCVVEIFFELEYRVVEFTFLWYLMQKKKRLQTKHTYQSKEKPKERKKNQKKERKTKRKQRKTKQTKQKAEAKQNNQSINQTRPAGSLFE